MLAPFGFGVSDFIAVGTLAWKVCKDAPEAFSNISQEVASLHVVIKEAEDILFAQQLKRPRQESIRTVTNGCAFFLRDLQRLIEKYPGIDTEDRRFRDRIASATSDIAEVRARLTSHVGMINVLISTSQIKVERRLEKLLTDEDANAREGSIISIETIDSLTPDERIAWREIRKSLEAVGITLVAFQENQDYMTSWIVNAVNGFANHRLQVRAIQEKHHGKKSAKEHAPKSMAAGLQTDLSNGANDGNLSNTVTEPAPKVKKDLPTLPVPEREPYLEVSGAKEAVPGRLRPFYNAITFRRTRARQAAQNEDLQLLFRMIENGLIADRRTMSDILRALVESNVPSSDSALEAFLAKYVNVICPQGSSGILDYDLRTAIHYESPSKARVLLAYGAKLVVRRGPLWIMETIMQQPIAMLETLCNGGVRISLHSMPEILAIRKIDDLRERVILLLNKGAQLDDITEATVSSRTDHRSRECLATPLMIALSQRHAALARLFIDLGASIELQISQSEPALTSRKNAPLPPIPAFIPQLAYLRDAIEAAAYSRDTSMLEILYEAGLRKGWLRALQNYHALKHLSRSRDDRSQSVDKDEIKDGYRLLMIQVSKEKEDWLLPARSTSSRKA